MAAGDFSVLGFSVMRVEHVYWAVASSTLLKGHVALDWAFWATKSVCHEMNMVLAIYTDECVLPLYTRYFPELCEKKSQAKISIREINIIYERCFKSRI